jgi:hypothetical protein
MKTCCARPYKQCTRARERTVCSHGPNSKLEDASGRPKASGRDILPDGIQIDRRAQRNSGREDDIPIDVGFADVKSQRGVEQFSTY